MKLSHCFGILGFASLGLNQAGAAIGYWSNFDAPTYDTSTGALPNFPKDLAGQDGWVINAANAPGTGSQTNPSQLSTFATFGGGNFVGTLGGQWSTPNTRDVLLSHSATAPLLGTQFSVDLSIQNPNPGGFEDTFGVSLKDGSSSNLIRFQFEPAATPANPANAMKVVWYDAAGTPTSSGVNVFYGGTFNLSAQFTSTGFTATIAGASSFTFGGSLTGVPTANINTVNFDWQVTDLNVANAGTNYITFDNLAVPEPSSMLTAGLALLGMTLRRRR
jgi:hypothetical protein